MSYWSELKEWLFKDPGKIIKYLVLFICCIIVIVQLSECFSKLENPPVSTHSYFNINDSIEMPAVTICREPAYKSDVLSNISGGDCPHPAYNTCWSNFPYDDVDLTEFFMNSTFTFEETFDELQHALNGCQDNIEITSSMQFQHGRCHTIRPLVPIKRANKYTGYSLMLHHHFSKEVLEQFMLDEKTSPGWHIYIHDIKENFTEVHMQASGRVEYVFAGLEEEIEIKLQAQQFSNIPTAERACSYQEGYSDMKCGETCIYKQLASRANCTGPWLPDIKMEQCNSYKSMLELIGEYNSILKNENEPMCECMLPCESRIFTTFIQNRKTFTKQPETSTQIYIYYTTKIVAQMMQERPSYDSTQFIADVGGSLGFLLGLSVLGVIGVLEHITLFLCGCVMHKRQLKHEKRLKSSEDMEKSSQNSDVTVDVASIYGHKF